MGNAVKFKHTNVPRQNGEQARLKVVQGPDYGAVYVFTGTTVTIGRGEENDAILFDLKTSRKHAEFSSTPSGWVVRDLGSANGIIYKGNPVRNTPIQSGDVFVIGETTLEFVTSDHPTMMLVAPPKTIQQVNAEQSAFEKQRERLRNVSTSFAGSALKKPKVLLGVVGVAALFLFFGLDESGSKNTKTSTAKTTDESRDLASYLPDGGGSAVAKEADMFFRAGFREYRTGNYLRAKSNFETVLQMSPNHRLARLYVENSDKAIEGAVKGHLARGKRSMTGGKLKDAKGQFEAVLRLLYRDQSNPNYVQAKEQIEKVDKMMKEVSE